jgi:regulator of PEP synthase PpsR (kinase-PPPase family)
MKSPSMGIAHTSVHCLQIDACDEAYIDRVAVKHPLLDKVRQCSTNPDQAASFFLHIFNRVYFKRIAAVDHPWIASTISRM